MLFGKGGISIFNAVHFTYDGIWSGIYSLQIASFDNTNVETTGVFAPALKVSKTARGNRFFCTGVEYDKTPSYKFSIISEDIISDGLRRDVLSWLMARRGFRRLQIHQPYLNGYYYNCVFSSVDMIYVNGNCHGFEITAEFDSPYAYGKPNVKRIISGGEETEITITNDSDILDDYVYPIVKFTAKGRVSGKDITIINESDDGRVFEFGGLPLNEEFTVDNELKIISGNFGGDKLSCFNKNWLRLKKGANELKVRINGEAVIECPTFSLIGF